MRSGDPNALIRSLRQLELGPGALHGPKVSATILFSRRWRCEDMQPMALTRQRSLVCFRLESDGAEPSFP